MNISTAITETIAEHPNTSSSEIARIVYGKASKADLMPLLVDEVERIYRASVRRRERSVMMSRIGPLLEKSGLGQAEFQQTEQENRERVLRLARQVWRLGNGDAVQIGKATVEEIDERIAMLRKQHAGIGRTIAQLEEVRAVLIDTGATCLDDLLRGAA